VTVPPFTASVVDNVIRLVRTGGSGNLDVFGEWVQVEFTSTPNCAAATYGVPPAAWENTQIESDGSNSWVQKGDFPTITIGGTGSITIIKDTQPDDAQDFGFTSDVAGFATFTLDDDPGSVTPTATQVMATVTPGTYTVTEALPVTGFDLTSLQCVETGTQNTTTNLGGGQATIRLEAGESVTCTYVNTKRGSITIIKDTQPDDAQDFGFTSDVAGFATFTLDDDPGSVSPTDAEVMTNVVPGTYTVTETLPVAGFVLAMLQCVESATQNTTTDAGTGQATIVLEPGENISCTYINREQGFIPVSGTRLTLSACTVDLRQDWQPAYTKLQFDVWNADEVKFTGAFECGDSWHETDFTTKFDAGLQNFAPEVLGTRSARHRVQAVKSQQCADSRAAGLLGVQSTTLIPGVQTFTVGTTLSGAGKFAGEIFWDPGYSVPEGGIR
jgi:hypothetical protein